MNPEDDPQNQAVRDATSDRLISCLSRDGSASIRALDATDLVAFATRLRRMSPTAATVLGRTLMGALLLAADKPDGETVQLQVRGDGPLGSVTAIAGSDGLVRGTVTHPLAEARGEGEHVEIPRAIGFGLLSVVRHQPSWREPVRGVLPLVESEVGPDLTRYLFESEQIPSAVGLSVELGRDGQIAAAGGFLIQALPDAGDDTLAQIEETLAGLPPAASIVARGGARALLARLTEEVGERATHAMTPAFHCPCTRARAARSVALLGREELEGMVAAGESQEVVCEFCGEAYLLAPNELEALVARL